MAVFCCYTEANKGSDCGQQEMSVAVGGYVKVIKAGEWDLGSHHGCDESF